MLKHLARCCVVFLALMSGLDASARQGVAPYSVSMQAKHGVVIPRIELPAVDASHVLSAEKEAQRSMHSMQQKRMAIAIGHETAIDPAHDGVWQTLASGKQLWRAQIQVPDATDLHIGFGSYELLEGAELWVIGDTDYFEGPYTDEDEGPLWVPMVPGDSAIIELQLPADAQRSDLKLQLSYVGGGFRNLFRAVLATGPGTSGACNINVVCPLGAPYTAEQRALAYYEYVASDNLTYICTGTLMANTAGERKNHLLTAAHCVSTVNEARSMRVYWNYRSSECARTTGYSFTQNQTGAVLRAARADADFSLVELSTNPNPSWGLYHAGWDASGSAPSTSIGLHHPNGDVAKVTESRVAPRNYDNCIDTGGSSRNTHWLAGPYNQGTTEGGSSGSGLWIPQGDASHRERRLIGILSGGDAFCAGSRPDNGRDCYGKLSVAFDGANAAQRLRDWLDPGNTGIRSIAGYENVATAPIIDPLLNARRASEQQARSSRTGSRGIGSHVPALRTNRSAN